MASADSLDTVLRTCITLEVPDTPPRSVSVLASEKSQETFPLPAPLAKGRVDALRTGRGLGIINTTFTSGEERFVARIDSPTRPIRFSFALSPGPTTVSLAGERGTFDVAGGQATVLSVPSALLNVVPPRSTFHNLCILVDAGFMESCLGHRSARYRRSSGRWERAGLPIPTCALSHRVCRWCSNRSSRASTRGA